MLYKAIPFFNGHIPNKSPTYYANHTFIFSMVQRNRPSECIRVAQEFINVFNKTFLYDVKKGLAIFFSLILLTYSNLRAYKYFFYREAISYYT